MVADAAFQELIMSDIFFTFVIFVLLFTLFYFALTLSKVSEQKNIRMAIAFAVAAIAIAPHFLGLEFDIVKVMEALLANFSAFFLGAIVFAMVLGLFGMESEFFMKNKLFIFSIVFLIVINILVFIMFPGVFFEFLTLSLLVAIFTLFDKELGVTAYLPLTGLLVFFALLYSSIIDDKSLPWWIAWIADPGIFEILVVVLVFAIIIRYIFGE